MIHHRPTRDQHALCYVNSLTTTVAIRVQL